MKPELLSPAGSVEAVFAAVQNGADAVYAGGKIYNARQYASNFDDLGLERIIDYSHERNVKVYLTLNILLNDNELYPALEYAYKAYSMGIDAIIVQDLGFSKILKENIPDIPLHASTQMTVYNKDGVNILLNNSLNGLSNGSLNDLFDRVVLARELSVKEISDIRKSTSAQLEIFIHGALCVCYSGQCLLSAAIGNFGGRSGNRGTCAQPCRLKYKLAGEKSGGNPGQNYTVIDEGHLLSPRDICSIEFLKELIDSGIDSFKIEGRMKSPEYVGIVTSKYRKAIDFIWDYNGRISGQVSGQSSGQISEREIIDIDKKEILQIFNRGGFSKGYFYGKDPVGTVFKESPKNMGVPLGTLLSYNISKGSVAVKLSESIETGDGIEIITNDEKYPGGIITRITVENNPADKASAGEIAELSRLPGLGNYNISRGLPVIRTSSKALNKEISRTFNEKSNIKKIPVDLKIIFIRAYPVEIIISSLFHNITYSIKSDISLEEADTAGIAKDRIISQASKTDIYPFYINSLNISFDPGLYFPVSELNNLRRKAFEGLLTEIRHKYKRSLRKPLCNSKSNFSVPEKKTRIPENIFQNKINLSVFFYNYNTLLNLPLKITELINKIILPVKYFSKENASFLQALKNAGSSLIAKIPAAYKEGEIREDLFLSDCIDGFLIGNIGLINIFQKYNKPLYGDAGFNACNRETVNTLHLMGLSGVLLSYEIFNNTNPIPENNFQLAEITEPEIISQMESGATEPEILIYGKFPVMISEYCPVGAKYKSYPCAKNCTKRSFEIYFLIDKAGEKYPVLCDNNTCRPEILSFKPINLLKSINILKQKGYKNFRINLYDEDLNESERIICQIRK